MSEEEEQMADDNFSSNEENSDANRTTESDVGMDQQESEGIYKLMDNSAHWVSSPQEQEMPDLSNI